MAGLSTRDAKARPDRLILDSGAVIGLARAGHTVMALVRVARDEGAEVVVPAVVVAETTRGGRRDATVDIVLKATSVVPATEGVAREAGRLLGQARSNATVDALVVAEAVVGGGGMILTGDPEDLVPLAGHHPEVYVQPI